MDTRSTFIIITFIVVIAIVILAEDYMTSITILSAIASFFVISSIGSKWIEERGHSTESAGSTSAVNATPVASEALPADALNPYDYIYGEDHSNWRSYITSYSTAYDEPKPVIMKSPCEQTYGYDAQAAIMEQKRAQRDKKMYEGIAVKDADFFRHHFADELALAEAKPWWGATDV